MKALHKVISLLAACLFLSQQTLPAFALPPAIHHLAPWTYFTAGDIDQKKETALFLAEFKTMLSGLAAEDMEPVLVCDLDATVTESNMPILPDNLEKVMKILKKDLHFVVLSGISKERVDKQFLDPLLAAISQADRQILENLIVASDSGTQIYRYSETTASFECVYAVDIRDYIVVEKYSLIKDILVDLLEKQGVRQMLRETMGWEFSDKEWNVFKKKCVDERQINGKVTQITFMVLGKEATHEQKEKFDSNGGEEIRKRYEGKIEEKLRASGIELEAKVSGLSSIDINLPGINKGSGLGLIAGLFNLSLDNMIFFGDSFAPEENDEPVLRTVDKVINVGKRVDIAGSRYYRENLGFLQLPEAGPSGFGLCMDIFVRHFTEDGPEENRSSFVPDRLEGMISRIIDNGTTPCVISDLDSTMAESNLPVSPGSLDLVARAMERNIPFAVITGADWKKMNANFVRPFLARISGHSKKDLLKNLIVVTDSGTQLYRFNEDTDDFECIYAVGIKNRIGDVKYREVVSRILPGCINELG
ncbi:MAG: HAD hydrolase family protein, partial [Candidatus Omnitrophota bacterium]